MLSDIYFLGLHRYAPAITLNSEVGWLAPTQRQWICMLKRSNRVIQMDDDRLTKKVFLWSYRNNSTWCSQVKEILYKLDLCSYFDFIRICDINEVKSKLFKYYEDEWKSKTRSLPKLRTYVTFKQNVQLEPYVTMNITKQERSLMARFRCGILPLRVETGRYQNEPLQERYCVLCKSNSIEDEKHFIFQCKFYENNRISFFHSINLDKNLDETVNLNIIMKNNQRQTAKYLNLIYSVRQSYLYKSK